METQEQTKKCIYGKHIMPFSQFAHDKSRRFGLSHNCRSCETKKYAKWRSLNRTRYNKKQYRHIAAHPERQKARQAVAQALKYGTLVKQPCEVCGVKIVHAHHPDYTKPLLINWLCMPHHEERHHKITV